MTDREQFNSRVVPVMDRVREELRSKQAEELRRYMRSPAYMLAGGVGPDGGMGSQAMALDSCRRRPARVPCSGRSRNAVSGSTTLLRWRKALAGAWEQRLISRRWEASEAVSSVD